MKALIFNGPRQITYESFDDPKINDPRNLVIRVEKCSICGSDLHMYHGDAITRHDYSEPVARFCTGHEAIGEVVEVGAEVRKHRVGDRIIVSGGTGCGFCRRCLAGQFNLCEQTMRGGGSTAYGIAPELNGGHAEYLEVRIADLGAARIPEGVTDEQAVLLTDAMATGYYGVKMAGVSPGDIVAVIGQGPIGLMAAEAAFAIGAARVFCIDPQSERRSKAAAFGGEPLEPGDAMRVTREATQGLGVDAVIEAVGVGPTLMQSVKLARLGGRISVLGVVQPGIELPFQIAQAKSLTIHIGIAGVANLWNELIPLVQAKKIRGDNVFTHHFSLSEGAEAFRMFDAREDGVMKTMLTP